MYTDFFFFFASQVMQHLVLSAVRPTASLWRRSQLRRVISRWVQSCVRWPGLREEKYVWKNKQTENMYLGVFKMKKIS